MNHKTYRRRCQLRNTKNNSPVTRGGAAGGAEKAGAGRGAGRRPAGRAPWTFLSNHAHVLICLAADPGYRLRDVADKVGITERAVQAIVQDLEQAGVLTRTREGRRNRYTIHADRPLRHPVEAHRVVADLLALGLNPAAR